MGIGVHILYWSMIQGVDATVLRLFTPLIRMNLEDSFLRYMTVTFLSLYVQSCVSNHTDRIRM
jgi:hypothetical protein